MSAGRVRAFRGAAAAGTAARPLMRRNIGLLCAEPGCAQALTVYRAAAELGARVSLVHPRFDPDDAVTIAGTGRILQRLYDAVVCVGLAPDLVQALRRHAEIPVLDESSVAREQGDASTPSSQDAREPVDGVAAWQTALIGSLA